MRDLTYHGEVDINYIVRKPSIPSDVLVVSFPGVGRNDFAASQLGYTYILTIGTFNVNALYIKSDHDSFSKSGMTAVKRDFKIDRTIFKLINEVYIETYSTRVIVIGSSMGGFCAIYYGLKYGYDIISGSPSYLCTKDNNVEYTSGGISIDDYNWCNNILPNVIKEAGERGYDKKIFVSWGSGEHLYRDKRHAKQMMADFDTAGIKYTVKLHDYSAHGSIHHLFPNIIKQQLNIYLGLYSEADKEEISAELKTGHFIMDTYSKLREQIRAIEQTSNPNFNICNRMQYGETREEIQLRSYVYAAQGYHWLPKMKQPYYCGGADVFWSSMPKKNSDYAFSFWFQQSVLNSYKATGDFNAFRQIDDNLRQFIYQRDAVVAIAPKYKNWWTAVRRLHFFLDFICTVSEKKLPTSFNAQDNLTPEIFVALNQILSAEYLPGDSFNQYRRLLAILHAAQYYRNHLEFFENIYISVLQVACTLIDYHFDNNGICIFKQTREQHLLQPLLRQIVDFVVANDFPEHRDFNKLKRQLEKIEEAAAHMVRADSIYPNLGHSDFEGATISPAAGNFIKPESNFAVLSDDLAYITVHGGSNIHSAFRHCDLLSFTFYYNGKQLVYDAGGGSGSLTDYSMAAVAHSALICDDQNYITPDYFDFTAIESAVERDVYVLITGRHGLYNDVTLTRRLLWCKPNVLVVYDEGESDAEHLYTQNFLLPNVQVDATDTAHISLNIAVDFTLTISQCALTADSTGFELAKYTGTVDTNAPEEALRGSRVVGFKKLERLLNLAYNKRGTVAKFLTVLEAHSGKADEVSARSASVNGNVLRVELSNNTIIEEEMGE